MYFSSLWTLLSFCRLDVGYIQEFHRSFFTGQAGWAATVTDLLPAVAAELGSALAGTGALAGHGIYEVHTFIYSKKLINNEAYAMRHQDRWFHRHQVEALHSSSAPDRGAACARLEGKEGRQLGGRRRH